MSSTSSRSALAKAVGAVVCASGLAWVAIRAMGGSGSDSGRGRGRGHARAGSRRVSGGGSGRRTARQQPSNSGVEYARMMHTKAVEDDEASPANDDGDNALFFGLAAQLADIGTRERQPEERGGAYEDEPRSGSGGVAGDPMLDAMYSMLEASSERSQQPEQRPRRRRSNSGPAWGVPRPRHEDENVRGPAARRGGDDWDGAPGELLFPGSLPKEPRGSPKRRGRLSQSARSSPMREAKSGGRSRHASGNHGVRFDVADDAGRAGPARPRRRRRVDSDVHAVRVRGYLDLDDA